MRAGTSPVFLLLAFVLLSKGAYAGRLDDFEADIGTEENTEESSCRDCRDERHHYRQDQGYDSYRHDHHDEGREESLGERIIGDIFSAILGAGGDQSMARVQASQDGGDGGYAYSGYGGEGGDRGDARENGELLIPYLRADMAYRPVDDDVIAREYQFELGYGAFAIHYNASRYEETDPPDKLDLRYVFGVYRMSLFSGSELDLGLGELVVNGNEDHSYTAFTMPFRIQPDQRIGFEFRPIWASNINDYDAAVLVGGQYLSLKAGYRWVETYGQSLNGSYIGVSLHY